MRRRYVIGSVIALAVLWVLPAVAESADEVRYPGTVDVKAVDEDVDEDEMKFRVTGQVRGRYEYVWNYFSQDPDENTNFDTVPYRAQIGVMGRFMDDVYGYVDLQAFGAMGDSIPDVSSQNVGTQNLSTDYLSGSTNVQLYQAFVDMNTIGDTNVSLRVGRAEHILGNELQMGNADFYNGLAFDGIRGWYDRDKWNIGAYYYFAVERNTPSGNLGGIACTPDVNPLPCVITPGFNASNVDARVGGIDFTWNFGDSGEHFITGYLVRNASRADTLTFGTAPYGGAGDHRLNTLGVLWKRNVRQDTGLDWSVEVAQQFGEVLNPNGTNPATGDIDLGGSIIEGWIGFKFAGAHRVRLGVLGASGHAEDDADDEFNGWVPLFTDYHQDNRLGNLDLFNGTVYTSLPDNFGLYGPVGPGLTMSNVTNANLRYEYTSGKSYALIALHTFMAPEDIDIGGEMVDSYGEEIDLEYRYQYSKHLNLGIAYSYFMTGDYFDAQLPPDTDSEDISRFWLQANLTW